MEVRDEQRPRRWPDRSTGGIAPCAAAALLVGACAGAPTAGTIPPAEPGATAGTTDATPGNAPFVVAPVADPTDSTAAFGVHFRFAESSSAAGPDRSAPNAIALTAPEATALLERLIGPAPAAPAPPAFRFPATSMPAPRPGRTVSAPFPAREDGQLPAPAVAMAGPPRILHTAPTGSVASTSQIAITFSRPMVRLTAPDAVPSGVRITPSVDGSWRWLDPSRLVFEASGELPKATRYTVEVPAGLDAPDGAVLDEGVTWTFTTAAPAVRDVAAVEVPYPDRPLIGITFDQPVDADVVTPLLRLEVNGTSVPVRIATRQERESALTQARLPVSDRIVVVRPEISMPADSIGAYRTVLLHVAAGVPSREGPLRSTAPATHEFRVRNGLAVIEHGCGRDDWCGPDSPWTIRFNYGLRPVPAEGGWVRIEPAMPGAVIEVWNDHIVVIGSPREGQTYTVTLDPSIAAWTGAELGAERQLTFEIGSPMPEVWLPGNGLATLPARSTKYTLLAQGADSVEVEVRAVSPGDFPRFAQAMLMRSEPEQPGSGPLLRRTLPVTHSAAGPGHAIVDLSEALHDHAHLLLSVRPVPGDDGASTSGRDSTSRRPQVTWIQRGDIVLDASEDGANVSVRAFSPDGRPVRGVGIALRSGLDSSAVSTAVTDLAGLATLAKEGKTGAGSLPWLLAAGADRSLILPAPSARTWYTPAEWRPQLRRHIVTDRPIYEPGDTVRLVGWLRRATGVGHDPVVPGPGSTVIINAHDPRRSDLLTDTLELLENGRFEASFVLPEEANAGRAAIQLTLEEPGVGGLLASFSIDIQETRRPNFDVTLDIEPGPHLPGDRIDTDARAIYFTGGPMPDSEMRWQVSSTTVPYGPPGPDGYTFGTFRTPWSRWLPPAAHDTRTDRAGRSGLRVDIDSVTPSTTMALVFTATATDVDRQTRSATASVIVHPAAAYVGLRTPSRFTRVGEPLIVDAVVVDPDGGILSGRPVHIRALRQRLSYRPGDVAAGEIAEARCELRSRDSPVRCRLDRLPAGDYVIAATVEDTLGRRSITEVALRIAGEAVPASARSVRDTLAVTLDNREYEPGDTMAVHIETSLEEAEALITLRRAGIIESHTTGIRDRVATLRLPTHDALVPNVQVHVAAVAPDGRTASGSAEALVAPTTRTLSVTVTPRSTDLAPGASTGVDVLVTDPEGRPVAGADVVLSGVDEALYALSRREWPGPVEEINDDSRAGVMESSLREYLTPVVGEAPAPGTVEGIAMDGETGRALPGAWIGIADTPRGAWTGPSGRFRIDNLPAGTHQLAARANGYVTTPPVGVTMTAASGSRVNFAMFTRASFLERHVRGDFFIRGASRSLSLESVIVTGTRFARSKPGSMEPPLLRRVFTPVAAFETKARTGPDGTAAIPVTVPHSLTRYRLRAVVSRGDRHFGHGESAVTVRQPLMLRVVPPRFLNAGDRFELAAILENRTDAAIEVDVGARAVNATLTDSAGRRVTVPADDRIEVRFPARVVSPGTATFQLAVSNRTGTSMADAAEIGIPVYSPAVTEAFASYGEIDDALPVALPVALPEGAVRDLTRVEVGFATTAAHGLRDALLFLLQCEFDLPEVRASRIIALSALRDVPSATPLPLDDIDSALRRDVASLARLQLQDGGWSLWSSRFDADPFVSVHAAHALQRAKAAGLDVSERMLLDATGWLERADEYGADTTRSRGAPVFPTDYPLQARQAVQAYALDVRRRLGHDVSASAAALLRDAGTEALPAEALAWLMPALAAQPGHGDALADIERALNARVVRSAGTAAVVSPYGAGSRTVFYSPRRSDAVVLNALAQIEPVSPLAAAMARGLFAHRVRGRWANTQENAFAVAALAAYIDATESVEPALDARAWADDRLIATHRFDGRRDVRVEASVPGDSLGEPGSDHDLTLARDGEGRLYYRVGIHYALAGLAPAVARGFEVSRSYEAVDDPSDVVRDPDGTWRIRAGSRVRVVLHVGAAGPRYHVAVVDPLPAGFEAVNPALAGMASPPPVAPEPSAAAPAEPVIGPFQAEHVNVKSDRFEAFTTLLRPHRRRISYIALATTPGEFTAPSPRAEEVYSPETFGRGAAERVKIEIRPAGG